MVRGAIWVESPMGWVIGRVPVTLQGNVYLIRVPFTAGDDAVKLVDQIEDLPPDLRDTFGAEEFASLGHKTIGATMNFRTLYNFTIDDSFLRRC
jgi:hypothetical protein